MREKQGALDSGTKGTDAGEGTRLTTGMKRKSTLLNAETHTLHLFLPENEKPSSVSDDSSLGIQASPIESIQTLAVRIDLKLLGPQHQEAWLLNGAAGALAWVLPHSSPGEAALCPVRVRVHSGPLC